MKVELVERVKEVKKVKGAVRHKRVTCKCGKEMTDSAFQYHKLRCESYKENGKTPYPVEKMSSEEAEKILLAKAEHHKLTNDGKWMKKLVYKCKIGEVMKISVPNYKEAQRISQLWKYYVKTRKLVAIVKISKTWKGKDIFLSMIRSK